MELRLPPARPGIRLRFTVTGVYDYFCIPHEEAGMVGRIIVGSPTSAGPPRMICPRPPVRCSRRSKRSSDAGSSALICQDLVDPPLGHQ